MRAQGRAGDSGSDVPEMHMEEGFNMKPIADGSGTDVLEMEQKKRKLTALETTCLRWKSHEEEAEGSGSEDIPEIESNMEARVSTR